jgi:hypothetical protein
MSTPHDAALDDQHLVRYLLGLLPEEEVERVDELSVVDDEVAWRLRSVEDDLVDGYVAGTLPPDTRKRFESYYLSSPRRREKVRVAASLQRAAERSSSAGATSRADEVDAHRAHRARRARWPRRSMSSTGLLAAAAVLLAAVGLMSFEAVRLRGALNAARQETAANDRRAVEAERQLAEQRAANAAVTGELERVRTGALSALSRPTTALVLLPQTRAIGPIPELAVGAGAQQIAFELRLESNDFSRYQVALKDPASNQIVWRSDPIAPTVHGDATAVSVEVPGRTLKPQHYSLDVSGLRGSRSEVVGSYAVRIVPR